jgi:hypothetical protein
LEEIDAVRFAVNLSVVVLIAETLSVVELAAKRFPPVYVRNAQLLDVHMWLMAIDDVTLRVAAFITDMLPDPTFATYRLPPWYCSDQGPVPTVTFFRIVRELWDAALKLDALITVTLLDALFATNSR